MFKRPPDLIIGGEDPYLLRWWVIPQNMFLNVYLHRFMRSDEVVLHDHPWWNVSIILRGGYWEHLPVDEAKQKTKRHWRWPFIPYLRKATAAHRIELDLPFSGPVWTLFITGPKIRTWGFWCPKGWRRWTEYVEILEEGHNKVGRGCND